MDRTTARTLAKTTLEATNLFAKVFLSEPESFGGYDPAAVVHSKSLAIAIDVRDDDVLLPTELYVTIYKQRPRDALEATKDAIEAQIDSLTLAAMRALWTAFDDARGLVIGPSETGYPQREFDSNPYRLERFPLRFDAEE
jgi:hypothetical protein